MRPHHISKEMMLTVLLNALSSDNKGLKEIWINLIQQCNNDNETTGEQNKYWWYDTALFFLLTSMEVLTDISAYKNSECKHTQNFCENISRLRRYLPTDEKKRRDEWDIRRYIAFETLSTLRTI